MLSQNFGQYNMWLAAENGMFLRFTKGDWMTTMPEHLNMEWVDSVKVCAVGLSISIFSSCCCNSDTFHLFSMYLSILQNEHLGHISTPVKLHLYGITSMQVLEFYFFLTRFSLPIMILSITT